MSTAVATPGAAPATGAATLPDRLLQLATTRSGDVALRVKRLGRWLELTWGDYATRAAAAGLGLRALGVGPGDAVGVLSENRPEWLFVDLGAQGIGAATVGTYPTSAEPDVAQVFAHARVRVVIVEDEEQLDKMLAVRDQLPQLAKIVVVDTRGIRSLEDPMTISLEEMESLGPLEPLEPWRQAVAERADGPHLATIVYTSGVQGPPQGVQLSHANLAAAGRTLTDFYRARPDDEVLSYLPLAHVAERVVSEVAALHAGYVVNFGEGGESFVNDLQEVQPTFFLGVPRVWEKLMGSVEFRIRNASWLKRRMYALWRRRGGALGDARRAGRARVSLAGGLGWLLLYGSLRRKLGMARVRIALSGAAPIATEVLAYFWSIGVPVREIYGQSENTGLAAATPATDVRLGAVGPALPGVELRVDDHGEVLVRSPGNFLGYLDDPAATGAVLDADGWLHSGDLGELDGDGYLTITGRSKELIVTAGGLNVSPAKLEGRLKLSPFVREAMVIGDRRPFLSALLDLQPDALAVWARESDLQFSSPADLAARPEVQRLVTGEVAAVNAELPDAEQLRAFRVVPAGFDEIDGLTATQKLRRQTVLEHYAALVDEMYAEA